MANGNYQPHWHRKNRPERKSVSHLSVFLYFILYLGSLIIRFLHFAHSMMSQLSCRVEIGGIREFLGMGFKFQTGMGWEWEWEWSHGNGREMVRKICFRTPLVHSTCNWTDLWRVDPVTRRVHWPRASASRLDWLQRNFDGWCSAIGIHVLITGVQFSWCAVNRPLFARLDSLRLR